MGLGATLGPSALGPAGLQSSLFPAAAAPQLTGVLPSLGGLLLPRMGLRPEATVAPLAQPNAPAPAPASAELSAFESLSDPRQIPGGRAPGAVELPAMQPAASIEQKSVAVTATLEEADGARETGPEASDSLGRRLMDILTGDDARASGAADWRPEPPTAAELSAKPGFDENMPAPKDSGARGPDEAAVTLVAAEELPGRSLARAQPLTPSSAGGALGPRAQAVSRASLLALTVYRQSLLLSYASLPAGLPAFELAQVGAQAAAGTLRRSSRRVLVPPFEPAQEELSAPAVSDEAASPLLASAFSVGQTEATADAETVSFMQSVGMRDAVAAAAPAPQARVAKISGWGPAASRAKAAQSPYLWTFLLPLLALPLLRRL